MTVKVYVSRDERGRAWPPNCEHEARAAEQIVGKLWAAFHHIADLYAVGVNLHRPNADMVIMTEYGLGVIELKHYPGTISILPDGAWCADGRAIILCGSYPDPHTQVQAYAAAIRSKALRLMVPDEMSRYSAQWDKFKFQTTVCFTHPDAHIEELQNRLPREKRQPWESSFSATTPNDIPEWAFNLRFGIERGRERHFELYSLAARTVVDVMTRKLGGSEWTEILELMPTGKPFASLQLIEPGQIEHIYYLHRDRTVIGRDPETSGVVIPSRFMRVSRTHALITRLPDRVIIEDIGSSHGTCVNNRTVSGKRTLADGAVIELGGENEQVKPCVLRYNAIKPSAPITKTIP